MGPNTVRLDVSDGAATAITTISVTVLGTPVADASATPAQVISPNNANATVTLNGSRSADPNGFPLTYNWFVNGNPVGTGLYRVVVLGIQHSSTHRKVYSMRNAIARRLKRLEELEFQHRAEPGPSLVAILLDRRRKRAIADGREPEPDPQLGCYVDSRGRPLSLADVMVPVGPAAVHGSARSFA